MLKRKGSDINFNDVEGPLKKQKLELKTQWCSDCKSNVDIDKFYKRRGDKLHKSCKTCFNKKNLQRSRVRVYKNRQFLNNLKEAYGGCFECKATGRLEFAHYDRRTKYRTKSGKTVGISQLSIRLMKEEVKKGRFLCHTCHVYETEQENEALKISEENMTPEYKKRLKIFTNHYEFIVNAKIDLNSCVDCKKNIDKTNHREFEFDHVPERGKKFKRVSAMTAYSIERIDAEIKKCDLVCFDCHKVRTNFRLEDQPNFGVTINIDPSSVEISSRKPTKNFEELTEQERLDKLNFIKSRCEIKIDDIKKEHWMWMGAKNSGGLGTMGFMKKHYSVHKLSYMLANNEPSLNIVHRLCNFKLCVNPAHVAKIG